MKFVAQIVIFNVDYVTLKLKTQYNSFLVKASCTCLFWIACINVQLVGKLYHDLKVSTMWVEVVNMSLVPRPCIAKEMLAIKQKASITI